MSVPKQRHTKTRRDRKRKRFAVAIKKMQKCPKCGKPIMAHMTCISCGFYKGREVVDTLKKTKKKKEK
jgi:large subunit ribosomal protein L32